jgi:hypothetical protein
VTPNDPEAAKAMANSRNQKERARYSFTTKRILATARDVDTLLADITTFSTKNITPVFQKPPEQSAESTDLQKNP